MKKSLEKKYIISEFDRLDLIEFNIDNELCAYLLAVEDKRFRTHCGTDFISLFRAGVRWLVGCPNGGASTIDMQLVRTLTNRRERTVRRKAREIILSIWLRRAIGHEAVLHWYYTTVYCGEGVKGFEAASQRLFGKRVADCDTFEKATLSCLPLRPIPRNPSPSWWSLTRRRALIAIRRTRKLD